MTDNNCNLYIDVLIIQLLSTILPLIQVWSSLEDPTILALCQTQLWLIFYPYPCLVYKFLKVYSFFFNLILSLFFSIHSSNLPFFPGHFAQITNFSLQQIPNVQWNGLNNSCAQFVSAKFDQFRIFPLNVSLRRVASNVFFSIRTIRHNPKLTRHQNKINRRLENDL